jgi:hypothetical protein
VKIKIRKQGSFLQHNIAEKEYGGERATCDNDISIIMCLSFILLLLPSVGNVRREKVIFCRKKTHFLAGEAKIMLRWDNDSLFFRKPNTQTHTCIFMCVQEIA